MGTFLSSKLHSPRITVPLTLTINPDIPPIDKSSCYLTYSCYPLHAPLMRQRLTLNNQPFLGRFIFLTQKWIGAKNENKNDNCDLLQTKQIKSKLNQYESNLSCIIWLCNDIVLILYTQSFLTIHPFFTTFLLPFITHFGSKLKFWPHNCAFFGYIPVYWFISSQLICLIFNIPPEALTLPVTAHQSGLLNFPQIKQVWNPKWFHNKGIFCNQSLHIVYLNFVCTLGEYYTLLPLIKPVKMQKY